MIWLSLEELGSALSRSTAPDAAVPHPTLTREDIMVIAGLTANARRYTCAAQEWIEEGREKGEANPP